jgi:hypothetical protein
MCAVGGSLALANEAHVAIAEKIAGWWKFQGPLALETSSFAESAQTPVSRWLVSFPGPDFTDSVAAKT